MANHVYLEADAIFTEDHVVCAIPVPRAAVFFPLQQIDHIPFALLAITGHLPAYDHTACRGRISLTHHRK